MASWRIKKKKNLELMELFGVSDIVARIKKWRLRWLVACGEDDCRKGCPQKLLKEKPRRQKKKSRTPST